jgi:TM2 domain-containing membrane protein YozV
LWVAKGNKPSPRFFCSIGFFGSHRCLLKILRGSIREITSLANFYLDSLFLWGIIWFLSVFSYTHVRNPDFSHHIFAKNTRIWYCRDVTNFFSYVILLWAK